MIVGSTARCQEAVPPVIAWLTRPTLTAKLRNKSSFILRGDDPAPAHLEYPLPDEVGVMLHFIRPGKPIENCFVESFNGTLRRDYLDAHWFDDLAQARRVIESWRLDFDHDRPHSGVRELTPAEFATLREPTAPSELQTPKSRIH